ncbi:PaaI family thioesterase [Poriferisphaera corsica]|uniref:PaaI family thioesterase n=1 Tax=Poriferisphaera corsica TaxID=2528020 RepID=UPI0011A35BC0|nr:PaaI family thioesterase [Poriferisphaera corsica]
MTTTHIPPEPPAGENLRDQLHAQCIICSKLNPHSLNLRCTLNPDNTVTATFNPRPHLKGFPNQLHGGILSAILDSAMAQCLLLNNIHAVTATLDIRFRNPAPLTGSYTVTAKIDESRRNLHRLSAKITTDTHTLATAKSQFVEQHD